MMLDRQQSREDEENAGGITQSWVTGRCLQFLIGTPYHGESGTPILGGRSPSLQ